ncbi:hypothetical protein LOB10_04600 [Lactobacillus delbrueckii subsp. lactis]|uniref:hypothetical protein n=2 Tax=Lactobacillus delbrueckii TaxID=1584 RepID=UPI001E4F10D8|nr:hypothetical protein [Lactobacillus delbrueckii]MCD5529358.1 hypothetical protein [Lactobacillus delbrueckii subsp. lactis]MCD5599151.1 hypothetical protein [Lactobacillus delbrueckii subsp. lactis]
MEEESALLGGNGMGESKEDKRMRAKWESLSGAEKSELKKNYAMRRGGYDRFYPPLGLERRRFGQFGISHCGT